eukprot:evm.model.NODE_12852_length_22520_cov_36.652222.7
MWDYYRDKFFVPLSEPRGEGEGKEGRKEEGRKEEEMAELEVSEWSKAAGAEQEATPTGPDSMSSIIPSVDAALGVPGETAVGTEEASAGLLSVPYSPPTTAVDIVDAAKEGKGGVRKEEEEGKEKEEKETGDDKRKEKEKEEQQQQGEEKEKKEDRTAMSEQRLRGV